MIINRIKKDQELFEGKYLDYSILLAIERKNPFEMAKLRPEADQRHIFESKCGKYLYHIAIIDYLTDYNTSKKMENFCKVKVMRGKEKTISAIKPIHYAARFINFMEKEVFIDEKNDKKS